MASIVKFFSASLVILSFFHGALAQCMLSNISIRQSAINTSVLGKPEIEVVVTNNCICSQSSLLVSCQGFQTSEPIDPSIFKPQGGRCSINNGQPLFQGSPIKFKYAWDKMFKFTPISSQINCS